MTHIPLIIVGAGFGGLGLGVRLRQAGIEDFAILERSSDLGGTWSLNTYPGAACDVPSTLYSYSFAPNPGWSRKYGTQPEILEYLRSIASTHGVMPHIHYDTEVEAAVFDEDTSRWNLGTNKGDFTCDVLVGAVGVFAEAKFPDLEGLDSFEGTQFHTLHWDHEHDLTGERVAVIGTGATAVQVIPEVQRVASEVIVYQRTPPWIVPRGDRAITPLKQRVFRALPLVQRANRTAWYAGIETLGLPGFVSARFRFPFEAMARRHLRRQVPDKDLRRVLTPDYMIGCKRAIFSDDYYPALTQENVEVVTAGIREVRPHSVVTSDGVERPVDTIIVATGFSTRPTFCDNVKGTHGRSINDLQRDRPQSYLGIANVGFPNMFTILGPFGAAGNQSVIFMIEGQINYIVDAVSRMRADGVRRAEIRRDVHDAFVTEVHARAQHGTWLTGGCSTYYTNDRGENAGLYPNWSFEYRRRTRRWDAESYHVTR
ncbi:flavin-containing monooxygenase [Mycolicibacterium llatzerense]|uniref:flavin-containing monooxygenase n=1 Tax=Mycolicibacterium llatzerense TaxID=280871 RepID=UPI0021B4EB48|nr:NAD(P)/FAD-dependent oxidoreductase [Mycolicibacterium llatzerense]MCT7365855.1 monooxygenase [Mycolicibacterium llatzerense]